MFAFVAGVLCGPRLSCRVAVEQDHSWPVADVKLDIYHRARSGGFEMSAFNWRRGAFVFGAFIIIGPALDAVGKSVTDNRILVLIIAGIGGALGLLVGLALDNYLFGRKN